VRGLPTYATPGSSLLKAAGLGLGVALVFAILFAWIPGWNFYLTLLLGFGVAEVMARAVQNKRGSDIQILAIALVAAGLILGRVFLAIRLDLTWEQINTFTPAIERMLHLELTPDGLFVLLAAAIPWYRFR
jgi:hypothetical protein